MPSKNMTIALFLIFITLGITGIIIDQCDYEHRSQLFNIGGILKIGFLIAFAILAIRGMSHNSKKQIIKSILPSILLAIIICIISSIVLGLVYYTGVKDFFEDVCFGLITSLATFYMIMPDLYDYGLFLIPYWIVYLALLSCAVMFVRKKDIKHFPMLGYISIILIVGIPFFFLHKDISREIAEAIAMGAMMNMG